MAAQDIGKDAALSLEQKHLKQQVEILERDVLVEFGGQPAKRSADGVDKHTGETILYRNVGTSQDKLLRDKRGVIITPDEYAMQKEGWGRRIADQPKDEPWIINANVGIRTRGDDALNIVLVETKGNFPLGKEERFGKLLDKGEDRRWEFHVSRKGVDAANPSNVLKVPVFSAFGPGLYADIGNAGSTYTSRDFTGNAFYPQKVTRNADNIEIVVPPPAGKGVVLAILSQPDSFARFVGQKAFHGGSIVVPNGATERVAISGDTIIATLAGENSNWGEIRFTAAMVEDKELPDILYEYRFMPQDELIWRENKQRPDLWNAQLLTVPAIDRPCFIPEGKSIKVYSNTGSGSYLSIGTKIIRIPPHNMGSGQLTAWDTPPVLLHGPGNKGRIDLSELDGNIVITGGGTIQTAGRTFGWKYVDVSLVGGNSPENKAIYTIEIPQFEQPHRKLTLRAEKGNKKFHVERYPMPHTDAIYKLFYPDGDPVLKGETENDSFTILGTNIEVRVKEGEKIRTIYDSDKPELNKQSGVMKKGGLALGGMVLVAMVGARPHSRRQFLGASIVAAGALLTGGQWGGEKKKFMHGITVRQALVPSRDVATASIEELMPGLKIQANGRADIARKIDKKGLAV